MKFLERFSETIYRAAARKPLARFEAFSIDKVLASSLSILDEESKVEIRNYLKNQLSPEGGFKDRGGKADIYYTLFGYLVSETLGLNGLTGLIRGFVESEITNKQLSTVHMHCAAILAAKLQISDNYLNAGVRVSIRDEMDKQPAYRTFLNLLTCYYINDFEGLYRVSRRMEQSGDGKSLPCPVNAALLIIRHSFNRRIDEIIDEIWSFYDGGGGFRAVKSAPLSDLLSTAVSLYALRFAGVDLRRIRPQCLEYVDGLYNNGGFAANRIDSDPDTEYTFYGLLALGALS